MKVETIQRMTVAAIGIVLLIKTAFWGAVIYGIYLIIKELT